MNGTNPTLTPETKVKLPLAVWILLTATLASSFGGAIGSYSVMSYKISAIEARMERIEARGTSMQEKLEVRVEKLEQKVDSDTKLLHRMAEKLDTIDRYIRKAP